MSTHTQDLPAPGNAGSASAGTPAGFYLKIAAVLAAVAVTVGLCFQASDLNTISEPGVEMTLPDQVGNFFGRSEEMSEAEKKILPGDTKVVRKMYENVAGERITCSIVLSGGEKRSIHRPEICLPAQGWSIGSGRIMPITLQSGNQLEVMDLNLSRQIEVQPNVFRPLRSQFMYWFVGKDRTTADHKARILQTSWDRVFHKTNHRWAYVIVSAVVMDSIRPGGKSSDETTKMMENFIREIVPSFQKSEMTKRDGRTET